MTKTNKKDRLYNVIESDHILNSDSGKQIKYKLKREDIAVALSRAVCSMDEVDFLDLISWLNDVKRERANAKLANHKAGIRKRIK